MHQRDPFILCLDKQWHIRPASSTAMTDLLFIAVTVAFFIGGLATQTP
jgi:hypothetical protein